MVAAKFVRLPCLRTALIALCCLASSVLNAAEPAIRNLDIRGVRIGGTTTLTIDGDDLGTAPRLLLPFTAQQTLKPGSTNQRAIFEITVPADATPGYQQLRVVSEHGVSMPVVIGVDALPQRPLTALTDLLPIALHGTIAGGTVVETKFQGKAKQKIIIEVEAQRLGSKLRPVVHLYNAKKLQLAWAWPSPALSNDTRLEVILPEDGTYTISLHDAEYAVAAPGFFRLRVGDWSFVDQVFPPVLAENTKTTVELLGMSTPLRMAIATPKEPQILPLAWPKGESWSGPRPFVTVSSRPEFVEQPTGAKLQELPAGPIGVSGRLLLPFEEDRYRVAVAPGRKVRLEVFAERIGSPLDAALTVRNEKGDLLLRVEDSPGTLDPILEYLVPDKVTAIVVGVVDALGRGSSRGIYRLTIDPQSPADGKVNFKLSMSAQRISLPSGGRIVVPVLVERGGYMGKIDITSSLPLPSGVRLQGATIPAGADGTLLTLERGDAPIETVVSHWRGRGASAEEVPVDIKGHPLQRLQPWLASEIALAPTTAKASDFQIDWRALPPEAGLVPGSKLVLPIKVVRSNGKTTVKLTLLTSQLTPLLNKQPDPNKALRQEKPVEMLVKNSEGDITVLVPAALSAPIYDVTVQAELLAADKKVLATAFASVRRMSVLMPLLVKLDGTNRLDVLRDAKKGTTIKIKGKIERRAGLKADVALALTGLPAEAKAAALTVKADQSDFTLNVTLPSAIPAGEIKGLKLSGSFAPNAKLPNIRVRSHEVELTLIVK